MMFCVWGGRRRKVEFVGSKRKRNPSSDDSSFGCAVYLDGPEGNWSQVCKNGREKE